MCVSNGIYCSVKNNNVEIANIHIPVYLYLNRYGNAAINGWDGNTISINDEAGIILSPQVGAGQKESDNSFTGVLMGSVKESGSKEIETGLFGYHAGQRTIKLDSKTGSAEFGTEDSGKIVIAPNEGVAGHAYLRSGDYELSYAHVAAGTLFNNLDLYFQKDGNIYTELKRDKDYVAGQTVVGSNIYKASTSGSGMEIDLTDPHIRFGSGKFRVDSDGSVHASEYALTSTVDSVRSELQDTKSTVTDLEDSVHYFEVSSDTAAINIPCDTLQIPISKNIKFPINFIGTFKGVNIPLLEGTEIGQCNITIEGNHTGLTLTKNFSKNNQQIIINADNTHIISNLVNDYTITFVYKESATKTYEVKKQFSVVLAIQGKDGAQGIQGPAGSDGKTSYLHIAYANSDDGLTDFSTTVSANKLYIGQYTDFTVADSTIPSKYSWTLIKGADGQDGIQGPQGAPGKDGEKGDTGIGVQSIVEQYYLSTSKTEQKGGSWKETQDPWVSGKYIWTRSEITWTDGTITHTDPVLADALNKANTTANTANTNASNAVNTANTASSTANTAKNTANQANQTATNANKTAGEAKQEAAAATNTANTASQTANNAITQLGTTNQELAKLTTVVNNNYKDLQGQIDGAISTWFYNYEPNTPNTLPTKDWTTDTIKDQHLGDLFYIVDNDEKAGQCYRYAKVDNVYKWIIVEDVEVAKAIADAATAQATADGKATIYTGSTTPIDPQNGDLWMKSANDGILTYVNGSWIEYNKYTDDTLATEAKNTANTAKNTADTAKNTADSAKQTANSANQIATNAHNEVQNTVKQVDVEYYVASSETEIPTSSSNWTTTAPQWSVGKFIWSRQKMTFVDTNKQAQYSEPARVTGATGKDGAAGASAIQAILTNENHTLTANSSGVISSYTGAETSIFIYEGSKDVTSQYTITKLEHNVSGSLSGTKYTVTSVTNGIGGTVEIIATKGSTVLKKVFTVSVSKQGTTGSTGTSAYVHVRYSNDNLTFTGNSGQDLGAFMGVCSTSSSTAPTTFSSYKWSRLSDYAGLNKWRVDVYTKTLVSGNASVPTMEELLAGETYKASFLINDSQSTTWGYGDNFLAIVTTYAYFTEAYTMNTTAKSDDASSIYLNDVKIYDLASCQATSVTINFVKGWNKIQFLMNENSGAEYAYFYQKISELEKVKFMSAYEEDKVKVGEQGLKGDTGAAGNGISSVDVYYYLSTSSSTQTGGSWSTTAPTWVNGKYMWSKTKTTYTNGSSKESEPVCITGAKGSTGSTGATGTGVDSITEEYYLSTSKTTQSGGSWVTTPPAWVSGKYIWTRSKIVYKNPASTVYTTPVCSSEWEAANAVDNRISDKENHFNFKYYKDIVVYGDTNKFYPVIIKAGDQNVKRTIMVKRGYNERAPKEWNKQTHPGSLTLKILCNFGGWGGANYSWEIAEFEEMYSHIFGGATLCGNYCMFAIFLRGGGTTGAIYHLYSDQSLTANIYNYGWDSSINKYRANVLPAPQISYRTDYIQYKSDLCFGNPGNKTQNPAGSGYYDDLQHKVDAPEPRAMVANGTTEGGFTKYLRTSSQNEEIRIRNYVKLTQDSDKKLVSSTTTEYYLSTSNSTLTGGSWVTTLPAKISNTYLWTRQKIIYKDGSSITSTATCLDNKSGSRNLLIGTATATGDVASGTGTLVDNLDLFDGLTGVKTNTAWQERYVNLKSVYERNGFRVGDILTLSVYVKSDSATTKNFCLFRASSNSQNDSSKTINLTSNWQQIYFTFVASDYSKTATTTRIECSSASDTNYIYWAGWKLEKGNIASDWTPAPEDINESIGDVSDIANKANLAAGEAKSDAKNALDQSGEAARKADGALENVKQVENKASEMKVKATTFEYYIVKYEYKEEKKGNLFKSNLIY